MVRLPPRAARRRPLGTSRAPLLRAADTPARPAVSPPVAVTLVDDDPLTRAGVRAIVGRHRDLRLCGERDDLGGVAAELRDGAPRVLLVEASIAARDRAAALRGVLASAPGVKVLVFGSGTREEELFQVFDAGAAGYLVRRQLASDLVPAIRAVEKGERHLPADVERRLRERERRPTLTPRESDVLALMAEARSNATIAAVLGISVGTVKLHVRAVLAKLGAEDRVEAAMLAHERGFVARR